MNRALRHGPRPTGLVWWTGYLGVFGAALAVAVALRGRSLYQPYLSLSLGLVGLLLGAWILRPRVALCGTLFLATVSDATFLPWFPFSKNLSSRESISFVADAFTTSPLELSLVAGFAISVLRTYARAGRWIEPTPLFRPIAAFTAFVIFGLAHGLATGGDLRISVFEARSLFYVLFVFAIVTNECREPGQLRTVVWWTLGGVVVHSLFALRQLSRLSPQQRDDLEALGEHGASIAMNVILVTLLLSVIIHGVPIRQRLLLAVSAVPVGWAYLFAERRAAIAALGVAIVIVLIALFRVQRRTLRWLVPLIAILTVTYLGTFWSSDTRAGFPAQAIKTAIAADETSEKDQRSNRYRTYENWNVLYTIRSAPLEGQGFGKPFFKPIRLPQITDFVLRDYMPHNSFLWVWIKTGFLGFVAMVYMLGRSIVVGTDRAHRMTNGSDVVVRLAAVAFIAMYTVYSYLDLLWDARNTVLLGLTMAICAAPVPVASTDAPGTDQTPPTERPRPDDHEPATVRSAAATRVGAGTGSPA